MKRRTLLRATGGAVCLGALPTVASADGGSGGNGLPERREIASLQEGGPDNVVEISRLAPGVPPLPRGDHPRGDRERGVRTADWNWLDNDALPALFQREPFTNPSRTNWLDGELVEY